MRHPVVVFAAMVIIASGVFSGVGENELQILKRHGIGLDKESLIAALKNPKEEVVWAAANHLAFLMEKTAIPALIRRLNSDKSAKNKVLIGGPLARLGEPLGFGALKAACSAKDQPRDRIHAARSLLSLERDDCLEDVVEMMDAPDVVTQEAAIGLLATFGRLYKKRFDNLFSMAEKGLASDEPRMRRSAGLSLSFFRDKRGIDPLIQAIAREKDAITKQSLESDLHNLRVDLKRETERR